MIEATHRVPNLPNGWKKYRLGQAADIVIGGTPSRAQSEYWDTKKLTKNLWVSIADMRSVSIEDTAEYISDLGIRHSNVKRINAGEVLLSFKLTIGRVARAGKPLFTNEAIAAVIPIDQVLERDFLFYGLQFWNILQDVDQAIKGVTLNKAKLRRIEFSCPGDAKEQATICSVLNAVEQAISNTRAIMAKLKQIKQGLMQDLLTKGIDEHGNIRSEETHRFKDSPLGRIPEEWGVRSVGDLAKHVSSGITPRGGAEVYRHEGVLFIRSQNVLRGDLSLQDAVFIPQSMHRRMRRTAVFPQDVLLNITGASIGRTTAVPDGFCEANVNQHVCVIRLSKSSVFNARFLATFLESWYGQQQIMKFNAGSNREGLNYQQVESILVVWPKEEERRRIVEAISVQDKALKAEVISFEKLQRLKVGLMQDLLSGKVPVTPLMENV